MEALHSYVLCHGHKHHTRPRFIHRTGYVTAMMATLHSHTQNLGNGDRHDNELGSCIQRVLGIFDVHDGPAADHDLAIVLQVMEQALGSLLYVAKILVVHDSSTL